MPTDHVTVLVEVARKAVELASAASPGPWHACHDGECSCKTVWSGAEYPIASLECGEWGDQYPALRFVEPDVPIRELPGTLVAKAYLERFAYGSIPEELATADARFIVFARMALPMLAQEVLRLKAPVASGDTYQAPEHGWTCFHCGEKFKTIGAARDHFGADPLADPGCMIRVKYGNERGLLIELRKAQDELARYRAEDGDKDREMYAMQARHVEELRRAEEEGFARGVADMRKHGWQIKEETTA